MIRDFKTSDTEKVWNGERVKKFEAIRRIAERKLEGIDSAAILEDLAAIPGNRLEPLRGDRRGQHSISINMQYRICFRWKEGDAFDVEIVDYH